MITCKLLIFSYLFQCSIETSWLHRAVNRTLLYRRIRSKMMGRVSEKNIANDGCHYASSHDEESCSACAVKTDVNATFMSSISEKPVKMISFDLDDTLWPTKEVISSANECLMKHLHKINPLIASVPDAMHSIWNEQLKADPTLHPSPVNFTKLRYEGICRVLCDAGEECKNYAEEALSVFLSARNDVERMLFPDALATLNALKDRGIRLCAITNGNADVMSIPCFANMFEFCISAEQVGSSKPDIGPFMAALSKAGYSSVDTTLENNDCLWIHVGDDPHSDCLGAHKVGMIAVLIRPPCYSSSKNTIEQKDMNVFSGCVGSNQDVKPNHIHHELGCLSELIYLVDEYNMINHH